MKCADNTKLRVNANTEENWFIMEAALHYLVE